MKETLFQKALCLFDGHFQINPTIARDRLIVCQSIQALYGSVVFEFKDSTT